MNDLEDLRAQQERESYRRELQAPGVRRSLLAAITWFTEEGNVEDLPLLERARQSPPALLDHELEQLLGEAERRVRERVGLPSVASNGETGEQPLPDPVRNTAFSVMLTKLGDALSCAGSGTLSVEEGIPTWHVKIYRRISSELRGELLISEDCKTVRWVPRTRR